MADETYVLALTTAGSEQQAEDIAHALVERRLAACVNVVSGVCSVYRWQGRVTREEERLLLIKTTAAHLPAVEAAIRELHTYEVPELITLAISGGSADYLGWLAESVRPA
jgi:periplasmic divalent cation tolerance protein